VQTAVQLAAKMRSPPVRPPNQLAVRANWGKVSPLIDGRVAEWLKAPDSKLTKPLRRAPHTSSRLVFTEGFWISSFPESSQMCTKIAHQYQITVSDLQQRSASAVRASLRRLPDSDSAERIPFAGCYRLLSLLLSSLLAVIQVAREVHPIWQVVKNGCPRSKPR